MNRADFMRNLAELLADVSPAERDEAIQYYNDYFDDAGAENEQSVIASLGTPEQLARTIKAGLSDGGSMGEFTEKGFSGYEQRRNNEVLNLNQPGEENGRNDNWRSAGAESRNDATQQNSENTYKYYQENNDMEQQYSYDGGAKYSYDGVEDPAGKQDDKKMSGGMIALIVVLCVFGSPVLLGLGGGLFGGFVGLLGGLFGIFIGFGVAAIVLLVVGVCLFGYGIALLFGAPLGGLCAMGAGMICAALGLLFLWLTVMIYGVWIPALIRGIVKLCKNIFHKGGEAA